MSRGGVFATGIELESKHAKYPYLTETGALDRKSDWAQADE
eukprot:gene25296-biopygen10530